MARIESIRTIMALAVENNMVVEQLDVTTAYLNGTLNEKIYMKVPENVQQGLNTLIQTESKQSNIRERASEMLRALDSGNKVCLLNKAIYGLRQAGRCWNEKQNFEQNFTEIRRKKIIIRSMHILQRTRTELAIDCSLCRRHSDCFSRQGGNCKTKAIFIKKV